MTAHRTIIASLAILGLLGVSVPLAASDPGASTTTPVDACAQVNPTAGGACDTTLTPVAKDTARWKRVAGATAGATSVDPSSPTRYIDDLFAVGFRNPGLG